MNKLKKGTFWNVFINNDEHIISAVVNKWGIMMYMGKPEMKEIKFLISHFRQFSGKIFDPTRLLDYNFENDNIQKDWIAVRSVVIKNFYASFPNSLQEMSYNFFSN